MKTSDQMNFWQFTMTNAREAVRLYFQPARQFGAWLADGREPIDVRHVDRRLQQLSLRVEELHDEQRKQKASNEALLRKISQNQDAMEVRLRDLERQLKPAFDSLEDLDLRVKRLTAWVRASTASGVDTVEVEALATKLEIAQLLAETPEAESDFEQVLTDLRHQLRQVEASSGLESPLPPRKAKRTKGATGD